MNDMDKYYWAQAHLDWFWLALTERGETPRWGQPGPTMRPDARPSATARAVFADLGVELGLRQVDGAP